MILGGHADEIKVPLYDLRRSIATRFYTFSRDWRLQSLRRMSTLKNWTRKTDLFLWPL